MKLTKSLVVGAALTLLPTIALAQDAAAVSEEMVWIMNTLLFLIGGFLVFFMAAGFAMLEGGLVRSKNVTMQMTKNVALFSLATIAYWAFGYNLMYPLGTWSVENVVSGVFGPGVLESVGVALADTDDPSYASTGSDFFFQKYKDGRVNPMPGSNLALATLGMFILWLGWFGFNGGSQLAMGSAGDIADVSRIFANTNAAAAGGAVVALILSQVLYKKPDLTMILNGALAGLVSITAF